MKTLILNKGITKTALMRSVGNNNEIMKNEISWDADYDGKLANISVNIDDNGNKKHIDLELTNDDLLKILSIPSENKPLDKRLLHDFSEMENREELNLPIFLRKSKDSKASKTSKKIMSTRKSKNSKKSRSSTKGSKKYTSRKLRSSRLSRSSR